LDSGGAATGSPTAPSEVATTDNDDDYDEGKYEGGRMGLTSIATDDGSRVVADGGGARGIMGMVNVFCGCSTK
jgi:uncharacterized membrane protein